jgi:hypothetical protein
MAKKILQRLDGFVKSLSFSSPEAGQTKTKSGQGTTDLVE